MAALKYFVLTLLVIGACCEETTVEPVTDPATELPTTPATPAPTTPATPAPTTTPPAPTTTPPAPTTTPPAPTTTSPAPTTTAPAPAPTPAPQPTTDGFFRVTENNVTCIMFGGDVRVNVDYFNTLKKKVTATVAVPKPDDAGVTVDGACEDGNGTSHIIVSWGPSNELSTFRLMFNSSNDMWMLADVNFNLYMSEKVFINSTDPGKFVAVNGALPGLSNVRVDTNSSMVCRAIVDSRNFTTSVGNNTTDYTSVVETVGFKMQAFNSIPQTTGLQQGDRCDADLTSDLVPIAVGCALAALVLLVLISYLVGRRRRSAAYQSV